MEHKTQRMPRRMERVMIKGGEYIHGIPEGLKVDMGWQPLSEEL